MPPFSFCLRALPHHFWMEHFCLLASGLGRCECNFHLKPFPSQIAIRFQAESAADKACIKSFHLTPRESMHGITRTLTFSKNPPQNIIRYRRGSSKEAPPSALFCLRALPLEKQFPVLSAIVEPWATAGMNRFKQDTLSRMRPLIWAPPPLTQFVSRTHKCLDQIFDKALQPP